MATHYLLLLLFVVLSGVLQFSQNCILSSSYCGEVDTKLVIYSTIIPWIVIFGGFFAAILTFPGWNRVFSNTFGAYFLKDIYGMDEILRLLFQGDLSTKPDSIKEMLGKIYTNKSSLIFEMDITDVSEEGAKFPTLEALKNLSIISIPEGPEGITLKKNVYSMLFIKEDVGYAIWFWLIGLFCILVSTNTLLSSSCTPKKANYSAIFK
jgi:hypothetical protein